MTVHVDNTLPTGYVNEYLMLVTNDVQSTQIPLLVEGRVLPAITVSPSSLFMGVVEPGKKVTRQLVVKGKKPFRILSVTCDDKSFTFGAVAGKARPKTLHLSPSRSLRAKTRGRSVARSRSRPTWATRLPSWRPTRSCRHRNRGARDQGEKGDWLRRPKNGLPASMPPATVPVPFPARLTQPWHAGTARDAGPQAAIRCGSNSLDRLTVRSRLPSSS